LPISLSQQVVFGSLPYPLSQQSVPVHK
jgi:hypothetical protein